MLKTDVLVVGGGVAGLAAANALADLGRDVLVVERDAVFRDRIRGEAMHPWGAAEVAALNLVDVLRRADGHELPLWQRYADREVVSTYAWEEDIADGWSEWSVSHPALQEQLKARLIERGQRVLQPAELVSVRPGSGSAEADVVVGDATETILARLVIGADGQRSRVRRLIGGGVTRDPVSRKLGGVLVDGVDLNPGRTHQAFIPGGMAIVFRRAEGRARVYFATNAARADEMQQGGAAQGIIGISADVFPEGAFARAEVAGPAGFFPGADVVSDCLVGPGVVLVGDAAGANDPIQGHGLSLAFRDARLLRDLLASESDWQAAIEEFARQRVAYFAPLRAHAGWAARLMLETGPEADRLREQVARAREIDPTAGGFSGIHAFGPDGLVADEAARRHFFGEDLDGAEAVAITG